MRLFRFKYIINALVVLLFLGFGYYWREDISRLARALLNQTLPCQRPITYSIANVDPRFSLTQAELLNEIGQAEKIWEAPINKQLFEYSPTGDLKISFIYDYRQQATDAMKKIGITIKNDRTTYDALKAKYDSFIASYNQEKAQIDVMNAAYSAAKSAYEKDVAYWNSRGGAPKAQYNMLQQQKANLDNQTTAINQAKDSLNNLVENINSTGTILNKLVGVLNLHVGAYNAVGASTGKEFNEGEYISNASGAAIDIFQFNDANQLVRVLAHELGHALGLEHLDNPKAIMFYLNEGMNEKLTVDDLTALKNKCGIK